MAFPTSVNDQTTDSVTQSNVSVVAEASAMAMGSLYQGNAHSIALSFENSVSNQNQNNILAEAVTTNAINHILSPKK